LRELLAQLLHAHGDEAFNEVPALGEDPVPHDGTRQEHRPAHGELGVRVTHSIAEEEQHGGHLVEAATFHLDLPLDERSVAMARRVLHRGPQQAAAISVRRDQGSRPVPYDRFESDSADRLGVERCLGLRRPDVAEPTEDGGE